MVLAAGGGLLEGWGGMVRLAALSRGMVMLLVCTTPLTGNAFGTFCGRAGRILALSGPSMTVTNYEPFLNIKVCWRRGQLDPGAFDQTTIRYVRYRRVYGRYTLGGGGVWSCRPEAMSCAGGGVWSRRQIRDPTIPYQPKTSNPDCGFGRLR